MGKHRAGRALRGRGAVAVVGVLLLGATLSGCSGGSDSAGGSGSAQDLGVTSEEAPAARDLLDSGNGSDAEGDGGSTGGFTGRPAGRVGVEPQAVISVGTVDLEGKDLTVVRQELDRLLGRYGGYVTNERTVNDDEGTPTRSSLQLRVPSARFDDVMRAFEEFSTVNRADREATDVTTEVIDVDARVRTQEVSLERLRKFLGRARDVNAMIRLESEIARREADLGSLLAQQKFLSDQTSMATIDVTMNRSSAARPSGDANAGFLTGVRNGWDALVDVLMVTLTVLGVLAPFALLLVLVGGPFLWWARSFRRRNRPVVAPDPVV